MYGYKKSINYEYSFIFKEPINKNDIFKNDDNIKVLSGFNFDRFIHIRNPIETVRNINSKSVDENCVIRNWTYQILIDDLNKIGKEYDVQIFKNIHY